MAIPDADLAPLRFDLSTWGDLETVFGVDLNEACRAEIMEAVDQFVVASHFRAVDDNRGKLRGSTKHTTNVRKLRGRIERVLQTWRETQDDPVAKRLLEDVSDSLGLGDIAETIDHLHNINRRLDLYLSARKFDPFPPYVARIKAVFESATGKPARVAIPTENSRGLSQFVAVMMTLDLTLPPRAQRNASTDAAWSQAVYRAIYNTKRG